MSKAIWVCEALDFKGRWMNCRKWAHGETLEEAEKMLGQYSSRLGAHFRNKDGSLNMHLFRFVPAPAKKGSK